MNASDEIVRSRLRDAFENRRCVSAWRGHADVLFVGFGEHVLPAPQAGERHAQPPYELETKFADWHVEGGEAEALVGETVVGWELVDRHALRVVFLAVSTDGRVVVVDADLPIRDWIP